MKIRIVGGTIVDPGRYKGPGEVWIEGGRIAALRHPGEPEAHPGEGGGEPYRILDARQKIVAPGLVDLHVHLREPGFEHKETIASGCLAAVSGGFTAVCCMANTKPVNDAPEVTRFILERAERAGLARVYPAAAVTRGLEGRELCDHAALKAAGAAALSDDGRPLVDSRLMRRALEIGAEWGLPVIAHCEDPYLAAGGVMNEGPTAAALGVPGIPNACESIMVMREIALSELTGAPVHIAHVSTAESVAAIRAAKARGVRVTAETAPHYFLLTEEAVRLHGANAKMNPPLRRERDRRAVREGLADGTIDVIATDHAPHAPAEKEAGLAEAPNGVIGLETALPLSLGLVAEGLLTIESLIEKMSINPLRILGKDGGIIPGLPADLTIIDPRPRFAITAGLIRSKSRNTPFLGMQAWGRAAATIVAGRIVYEHGETPRG